MGYININKYGIYEDKNIPSLINSPEKFINEKQSSFD